MYTNILLPIDESIRTNELITDEAEYLVRNTDNNISIHALYVEDEQYGDYDSLSELEPIQRFNKRSDKWSDESDHVDTRSKVIQGSTVEEISKYADEHDIDLIIMAKNSRSTLKELVYGSTTDETIEESECPVLVINKE
jgi:nucleotide-binding universal stress UspA family protein